jgi:hypothetical protein
MSFDALIYILVTSVKVIAFNWLILKRVSIRVQHSVLRLSNIWEQKGSLNVYACSWEKEFEFDPTSLKELVYFIGEER